MKQARPRTGLARLIAALLAVVLAFQGLVPSVALAERREVSMENHVSSADQTTTIGVNRRIAQSGSSVGEEIWPQSKEAAL